MKGTAYPTGFTNGRWVLVIGFLCLQGLLLTPFALFLLDYLSLPEDKFLAEAEAAVSDTGVLVNLRASSILLVCHSSKQDLYAGGSLLSTESLLNHE